MTIKCKLNLDRYDPQTLIQLCEEQVISLQELIDSKRAHTCFTSILHDYINNKTNELGEINYEDTLIADDFRTVTVL